MTTALKGYRYKINLKKAQSLLEYSVLIACVAGALIAMQIYTKRGIQGRLKQAADEIGEHYAPENTTTNITTTLTSNTPQVIKSKLVHLKDENGVPVYENNDPSKPVYGIQTEVEIDETTTRSGSESLGKFEKTLFP